MKEYKPKKYVCKSCLKRVYDCLTAYCLECVGGKDFPKDSFWNNRVVVSKDGSASIREVHYSPDGKIEAWTGSPKALVGNDVKDLLAEIESLANDVIHLNLTSCSGLALDEKELQAARKAARELRIAEARKTRNT